MINVEFMGPMGSLDALEIEVESLKDLKEKLQAIPEVAKWLKMSAVAVNENIIEDLNFKFSNGDKVVILPPVCGG